MSKEYKIVIYLILILGIFLRINYIAQTPITERQHDVYEIQDEGHLGYIYTIYQTGELPKTNNIQFYHPPLFHLISAGWLKAETMLGMELNQALEGLQVLTLLFSSLILVVVYRILVLTKIKDIYKLLIFLVMTFHPTFIILSRKCK